MFPKIGVPQNGWFIMVPNPIKMDDLGGFPIFLETPIYSGGGETTAEKGKIPLGTEISLGMMRG